MTATDMSSRASNYYYKQSVMKCMTVNVYYYKDTVLHTCSILTRALKLYV